MRAHIEGGRVVLDEPMDLPDGTIVHLVPVDDADELDEREWAELQAELAALLEEAKVGQLVDLPRAPLDESSLTPCTTVKVKTTPRALAGSPAVRHRAVYRGVVLDGRDP